MKESYCCGESVQLFLKTSYKGTSIQHITDTSASQKVLFTGISKARMSFLEKLS